MAFLNGLFGGYTEEDFLDEDEKRLRRESARRSRDAHKKCAADHADDKDRYSTFRPAEPATHAGCAADHSDDGVRKTVVTPAAGTTQGNRTTNTGSTNYQTNRTNPNSYSAPRTNYNQTPRPNGPKVTSTNTYGYTAGVVALVLFLVFFVSVITVLTAMESSKKNQHDRVSAQMSSILAENQDILSSMSIEASTSVDTDSDVYSLPRQAVISAEIITYANENHSSKSELIDIYSNYDGFSESLVDGIVSSYVIVGRLDFGENAVARINESVEEGDVITEEYVRTTLEGYGFTEEDIEYALAHLDIAEG